jgi:signal transduction histidine kinase
MVAFGRLPGAPTLPEVLATPGTGLALPDMAEMPQPPALPQGEPTPAVALLPVTPVAPAIAISPARPMRAFAVGAVYGVDGFDGELSSPSQWVRLPVLAGDNEAVVGYVEVGGGVDYGRAILIGVALAWLLASAVAVLLAALIGWLISRRISAPLLALTGVTTRMAGGELSARASLTRPDEFGLLAHSFNIMAGQVEITVETLRRFVADAAHEINTPLTALRNSLDLALEEGDRQEQAALLKHGRSQVQRLEELSRNLLALSRLEAKATTGQYVPVNLSDLVLKTSEIYASQAEEKEISLRLEAPEGPLIVRANQAQLQQALGNLIDNALKFTEQGGMVTVALSEAGEWAMLAVTDTGIGIPEPDLPHLFNRFYRARNAMAYPGSGLGLALVRAIVEGHGGQVAAENRAAGACFTLKLPLVA